MKKNKHGFTLVELLAVVVILGIILAIAIPSIGSIVSTNKKAAFISNLKLMIKTGDLLLAQGTLINLNTATAASVGGVAADYSSFAMTGTASTDITINATGAAGGKFSGCTTTSARTMAQLIDGNITGC